MGGSKGEGLSVTGCQSSGGGQTNKGRDTTVLTQGKPLHTSPPGSSSLTERQQTVSYLASNIEKRNSDKLSARNKVKSDQCGSSNGGGTAAASAQEMGSNEHSTCGMCEVQV